VIVHVVTNNGTEISIDRDLRTAHFRVSYSKGDAPQVLSGLYTSEQEAKNAIDRYIANTYNGKRMTNPATKRLNRDAKKASEEVQSGDNN